MAAEFHNWKTTLVVACAGVLAVWAAVVRAQSLPQRQFIAITAVTVIDVERGRSIGPRTVLIDDGRIRAILPPSDVHIPEQAQRVDGRGRFLLPGLVDMHVHLFNTYSRRPPNDWSLPLYIANGVTAVREMNADPAALAVVNRWRQALREGELIAPRILAAGVAVGGSSPVEAARRVDAAAAAGADFIKVFSEVPLSSWRAILQASRGHSLSVVGHVPAALALQTAAVAGQRSNEHLMQAFEACTLVAEQLLQQRRGLNAHELAARRDAQESTVLSAFDQGACRRVARTLAAAGQVQVPTLVLFHAEASRSGEPPGDDPRWRYLRADERARWQRTLASATSVDDSRAQRRWRVAKQIVSAFQRATVPILSGTDAPMPGIYPGFSLHEELALLVAAGLTPHAALRAATLAPAEFLGIAAQTGAVAVGRRADLVLLDADPTQDINNTRHIHAVLLDGRLLRRADLDALLERAASAQMP